MHSMQKPQARPDRARFSSGPCVKRPGWRAQNLPTGLLGRSHRAPPAKARLQYALELTREILGVPQDYLIGIVPASDTGAFEMALWSLLGERGVDVLAWESFGEGWRVDITEHLKITDTRVFRADYGALPSLGDVSPERDVVFTWNGTTSGVRVPNGDWIADTRTGLSICDATSAAFAQDLPFNKLDVVTYSWQKVLGGEAAHGMLILSPRAVQRLETTTPPWPLPKIFRLTKGGKVNRAIFAGATINTPSMLCVEDYVSALEWARSLGGLSALMGRCDENAHIVAAFVENNDWLDFLCPEPDLRSNTCACLKIVDPAVTRLPLEKQAAVSKAVAARLAAEDVAYDIGAYRDAPPGFRIWTGATVQAHDVRVMLPWLAWSFALERSAL